MTLPDGHAKEDQVKLYYLTGACSLACSIALREAGLKFELVKVDRKTKRAADGLDYHEVNPKGYVPALTLDDGQVLTENIAILQYIADRNPAAKLAPAAGTIERYRLEEWLSFVTAELHKGYTPLFRADAPEAVKEYARKHVVDAARLAGSLVGLEVLSQRRAVHGRRRLPVRGARLGSPRRPGRRPLAAAQAFPRACRCTPLGHRGTRRGEPGQITGQSD